VALAHDGDAAPTLILDAGTGLRAATALLGTSAFKGTILLSHLHWDHVQGLPFFAAGDREDSRVALVLPEQEDGADAATVLARSMSPPHFPMTPQQLRGSWSFATIAAAEWQGEGFTVLAREIPHAGGRTFGYRISDGRTTVAYMPDHCPTELGNGPDGYGEYHPAALELACGADAVIHDAHLLTHHELTAEARFGHAAVDYAVELGRHARAHRVVLFHHRPDRTDDALDDLASRFKGSPGVTLAAQGTVLEL
jgi:phosphoribosyl 1,2-cyclic phosphodiesterase